MVILGDFKRYLCNGHYAHFYKKNKLTTYIPITFISAVSKQVNGTNYSIADYIVISKSKKCASFQPKAIQPLFSRLLASLQCVCLCIYRAQNWEQE